MLRLGTKIAELLARNEAGKQARRKAGQFVKAALVPQSGNKVQDVVEGVISYAPEPLYAAMQMAAMPDGTSVADRLLVGVEDLGLGMLASGGGRLGGALAASRLPANLREIAPAVTVAGDVLGNVGVMAAPRPQLNRVYEKLGTEQQEVAQAQEEMRQQELIKTLIESGLVTADGVRLLT